MTAPTLLEPVDAVIVGAGAAGCLYARRLAEAGKSVVVLEAGPPWNLADLKSSQIWARRLKWGGSPVYVAGEHPFGHNMATGWGLGGAALHHYAAFPRLHAEDLKTHSHYGRGLDWPVSYDELRPWYDRVQQRVGIAGDAERETWRPPGAPYPLPPLKVFAQGRMIRRGFDRLGLHTAPLPLAINPVAFAGRGICTYDGWCDAGCPLGALANPLVLDFAPARRAGAEFRTWSSVVRVVPGRKGRVSGVEYRQRDGERFRQPADLVILAAAGVQNARLLLNSACAWAPDGLGNSSGLVGRYFHCHTLASAYGVFDEETENHKGVNAGSLMCQDGYRKDARPGLFGSRFWGFGPALKPNDLLGIANTRVDLFGQPLIEFMETKSRRLGVMSAVCEALPQRDNRIELDSRTDATGMPAARVVHTLSESALALWQHVREEGMRILRAAGAREAWAGPMGTAHVNGGTIMGDDPARSVTDSFGRSHDVENLVLAGSGLFPTAGAGSPTFTIYALIERSMAHIL